MAAIHLKLRLTESFRFGRKKWSCSKSEQKKSSPLLFSHCNVVCLAVDGQSVGSPRVSPQVRGTQREDACALIIPTTRQDLSNKSVWFGLIMAKL